MCIDEGQSQVEKESQRYLHLCEGRNDESQEVAELFAEAAVLEKAEPTEELEEGEELRAVNEVVHIIRILLVLERGYAIAQSSHNPKHINPIPQIRQMLPNILHLIATRSQ